MLKNIENFGIIRIVQKNEFCGQKGNAVENRSDWREEEWFSKAIYGHLEGKVHQKTQNARRAAQEVEKGRYEDQDSFISHGERSKAQKELSEAQALASALWRNPYFAHVRLREEDEAQPEEYFLSSSATLDRMEEIPGDGQNVYRLIPFIRDEERPFFRAVFDCYQRRDGEKISYDVPRNGQKEQHVCQPLLVRNVTVQSGKLQNVHTLYSSQENEDVQAQELLLRRLEENRATPGLHNIIDTLQPKQFKIVNADPGDSFVVQGCAGSGKSQCMIHRLFYLRKTLEKDWDKVLWITPTQLFRNYTQTLLKKYRLDAIDNASLAELYRRTLQGFDSRFASRQYRFELTEEYLPDAYLREVYAPEQMASIDAEIQSAISVHIKAACEQLARSMPDMSTVDIEYVREMEGALSAEIREMEATEGQAQEEAQRAAQLEKELDMLRAREAELVAQGKRLCGEQADFLRKKDNLDAAQTEERDWAELVRQEEQACEREMRDFLRETGQASQEDEILRLRQYTALRRKVMEIAIPTGERAQFFRETGDQLKEVSAARRAEFYAITGRISPEKWECDQEQKVQEVQEELADVRGEIAQREEKLDKIGRQETDKKELQKRRLARLATMKRVRHYLRSIESSVFEQEVWRVHEELKQKYGIQTLQIEERNGHRKETRILYKVDLLFYLKIYLFLHKKHRPKAYHLICVDEGQDLHSADYAMLRELFPGAVFNVFGDTAQALHINCGIQDWRVQTGIERIYTLNDNYRNTADIVDFCNRKYGSQMQYCGQPGTARAPRVVGAQEGRRIILQEKPVVIVKNQQAFEELRERLAVPERELAYIDTKIAEVKVDERRIRCYSIFAAKGLEFQTVLVYDKGMTRNQKMVACTRAMQELAVWEA